MYAEEDKCVRNCLAKWGGHREVLVAIEESRLSLELPYDHLSSKQNFIGCATATHIHVSTFAFLCKALQLAL